MEKKKNVVPIIVTTIIVALLVGTLLPLFLFKVVFKDTYSSEKNSKDEKKDFDEEIRERFSKITENAENNYGYQIIYNGNGSTSGKMDIYYCFPKLSCTIRKNNYKKNGYVFVGWTTNKNGTDDKYGWTNWNGTWNYTNGQRGITNNKLTLYAMWKKENPTTNSNNTDNKVDNNNTDNKVDNKLDTNTTNNNNDVNTNNNVNVNVNANTNTNANTNQTTTNTNNTIDKTIKISPSRVYLKYGSGNSVSLKASLPEGVEGKTITWKSSNSTLVQVNKTTGKVTAYNSNYDVLLGDAIITATTEDGYQGMIRVTVTSVNISVDRQNKKFIINEANNKVGRKGSSSFNINNEYNTCKPKVKNPVTVQNTGTASNTTTSTADKIHFVDVARGDATLIESNGKFGLIDVGYDEEDAYNYIGNILKGRKLSFVILTHWHSDHVGGLYDIIREGYVDSNTVFYFNKPATLTTNNSQYYSFYCDLFVGMRDAINNDNNIKYVTNKGDITIKLGDIDILILENNFPDGYYPDEAEGGKLTNENRNSIGALITYKNKTRVLVTGDMGEGDEYRISEKLSSKGINKIDVYKMGHHGATPAAYTPFLDYIEPTNVVIANTIDSVRPYGNENLSAMCYMQYMFDSKLYLTGNTKKITITKGNSQVSVKGAVVYNFSDNKFYNSNTTSLLKANEWPLNLCTKNDKNGVKTIKFTNATDEYKDKTCDLYFEYGTFIVGTRDGKKYKEVGTPSKDYYRSPGRICY